MSQGGRTRERAQQVGQIADRHSLRRLDVLNVLRVVLRDELLRIDNFPGPEDRPSA
ncbi:MAG: hypothetical protein OXE58_16515 [Acidobacteria bacterium]|nr:hypothetical protein [Acidobacteriota bacterium]